MKKIDYMTFEDAVAKLGMSDTVTVDMDGGTICIIINIDEYSANYYEEVIQAHCRFQKITRAVIGTELYNINTYKQQDSIRFEIETSKLDEWFFYSYQTHDAWAVINMDNNEIVCVFDDEEEAEWYSRHLDCNFKIEVVLYSIKDEHMTL